MTVRLAINGFGRTGRSFLRAALAPTHDFEVVAINDLGSPAALARLLARDSVHGPYPEPVEIEGDTMIAGHRRIKMLAEPEAKALPWNQLAIDVVVESTGKYTKRERATQHLEAGATRVRHLRPRRQSRRHLRHWCQRGSVRSAATLHHLQCFLHHELPRPIGQGPRRRLRHR